MLIPARAGPYELSTDTLRALQLRYPIANVERELLLAALWLEKNPARRPKLPLRFVENWLKKCSPKASLVDMQTAQWWKTERATLDMARRVGVNASPRDSWQELRNRIANKLSANG